MGYTECFFFRIDPNYRIFPVCFSGSLGNAGVASVGEGGARGGAVDPTRVLSLSLALSLSLFLSLNDMEE